MKKMYKILATAFAMVLVVASPMASITSPACNSCDGNGFCDDAIGADPEGHHPASDSSDSGSSYQAPAKNPNDVTVCATGCQKFRIVMSKDHTTYQVYHCGIKQLALDVKDAEGNAAVYDTVALEQGENGLWYQNIKFAEGVDTTGYTISYGKGDISYLATQLNIYGIKVNGTVALLTAPAPAK